MIRTARLVLRRAVWEDLEAVHRVMSDPRAMRYWSRPEHETLEETRHWLGFLVDQAPDSRDWLVEKDGEVIGKAGAWQLPEVGFILHPDHWGQGGRDRGSGGGVPCPAGADRRSRSAQCGVLAASGPAGLSRNAPGRADAFVARRVVRQHLPGTPPRGLSPSAQVRRGPGRAGVIACPWGDSCESGRQLDLGRASAQAATPASTMRARGV
jgi:hypothetical protein